MLKKQNSYGPLTIQHHLTNHFPGFNKVSNPFHLGPNRSQVTFRVLRLQVDVSPLHTVRVLAADSDRIHG